jgi:hypothetical protein
MAKLGGRGGRSLFALLPLLAVLGLPTLHPSHRGGASGPNPDIELAAAMHVSSGPQVACPICMGSGQKRSFAAQGCMERFLSASSASQTGVASEGVLLSADPQFRTDPARAPPLSS